MPDGYRLPVACWFQNLRNLLFYRKLVTGNWKLFGFKKSHNYTLKLINMITVLFFPHYYLFTNIYYLFSYCNDL